MARAGRRNCGLLIAECGLKKKTPKSEIRNSKSEIQSADAFCPEDPYPRAITQASGKCQTLDVPRQSRGFTLRKLISLQKEDFIMSGMPPDSPAMHGWGGFPGRLRSTVHQSDLGRGQRSDGGLRRSGKTGTLLRGGRQGRSPDSACSFSISFPNLPDPGAERIFAEERSESKSLTVNCRGGVETHPYIARTKVEV